MKCAARSARTPLASGRLLWLALVLGGCQAARVEPPSPVGEGPVVSPGPITEAERSEAASLYERAQASFAARRHLEVLRLTGELLERYPASGASGPALLLSARAEGQVGAAERADAAAERYIGLLDEGDLRIWDARLVQAEALAAQPMIRLDRLLRIGGDAPRVVGARAVELAREATDSLSAEELEIAVEAAPRGGVAAGPPYARLAAELLSRGEEDRAASLAREALGSGASGPDRGLAEGVLRGELPEELRRERIFEIATVLPFGGPPALAGFAAQIAEGVEVAVATVLGDEYEVTVVARDDQGDPELAARIVAELEGEPVAGVIGLLLDDALVAGAAARVDGLPLVSPTARSAAQAGGAVYSLEGADVGAAQAVAFYSVLRAHQRVAMVYPDTPEASEEADAFESVSTAFGIPTVGRFPYPPGATDFEEQFRLAQAALRAQEIAALGLTEADTLVAVAELLEPAGLFMPIPSEDVEFVAPQFAHHGLDTLAIEPLGTTGWTDPVALAQVDARLLEGVVATAAVDGGPASPGYARFRQAYEAYFQRSLVSTTPALGYDAALLLLEALRPGRLQPEAVERSFDGLVDVEGATGRFSIVEDRVVRRTEVVRIEGGRLVPVPIG